MNPLIRLIPPFFVRFFARPYVAGDSLDKAMAAVRDLWQQRSLCATLDLLAEDIREPEQAAANLETYLRMVEAAADPVLAAAARPTLSLKPSSYTTAPLHEGGDADGSLAAMTRIVEAAAGRQVDVTIDMESRHWTDFTLDAVQRLHAAGHRHVGCVLQTRLHRTEADLGRLPPGQRVRLVIGIYREPEDVALVQKAPMKQRLLDYAERLLGAGHYVEFASHDEAVVRAFVDEVVPRTGVGPDRFEVQMLYGVPRERALQDLRQRGITCRLYVPFANSWAMAVEYLRRRLDEYPAMMWLVTKNMFRRR
ncbi:MAG: proline dehydrogenase family protein [Planctomycetota bacterium]